MKIDLAQWGNQLHSGERTYPIVAQRKRWYTVSIILMVLSLGVLFGKGLNFGIDFTGGTEFVVPNAANPDPAIAFDTVEPFPTGDSARVSILGEDSIRIQMGVLETSEARELTADLAEAYDVEEADVNVTQIGPSWGEDIGKKALQSLIIFMILVAVAMTLYFRAWRMAAAALIALVHDLVFTVGIYALVGFEVTPASVIGFLTILGYSLYDTVVVFDKVRENTENIYTQNRFTYAEQANLAINQTLVRSINTSIVALLPVGAILFIGSLLLGAGTLKDIALALFVGMTVGTYSSIFVATPLEVSLRSNEKKIVEHTAKVLALRESGEADVVVREDGSVKVGALVPGGHLGTKAQPKRKRRS